MQVFVLLKFISEDEFHLMSQHKKKEKNSLDVYGTKIIIVKDWV